MDEDNYLEFRNKDKRHVDSKEKYQDSSKR